MNRPTRSTSDLSARRIARAAIAFGLLIPLLALTSFAMHSFGPYDDCEARIDVAGGGTVYCADPIYVGKCPDEQPCLDLIVWRDDVVMGIVCSCGGSSIPGPEHCYAEVTVYWNYQYMTHHCLGGCPDAGDTCNDVGPNQDSNFCECYH